MTVCRRPFKHQQQRIRTPRSNAPSDVHTRVVQQTADVVSRHPSARIPPKPLASNLSPTDLVSAPVSSPSQRAACPRLQRGRQRSFETSPHRHTKRAAHWSFGPTTVMRLSSLQQKHVGCFVTQHTRKATVRCIAHCHVMRAAAAAAAAAAVAAAAAALLL